MTVCTTRSRMIELTMRFRLKTLFTLGTMVSLAIGRPAPALVAPDLDTQKLSKVKAAFLLNFIKFTTWPSSKFSSNSSPLSVAVVGEDDLDGVLDATLRGREWNGHPIQIVRVPALPAGGAERQSALAELARLHVVYLGPSSSLGSSDLRMLAQKAVLSVAHNESQARQGAILGFAVEQGKVSFLYNANAAKESPLQISSKLLTLARAI